MMILGRKPDKRSHSELDVRAEDLAHVFTAVAGRIVIGQRVPKAIADGYSGVNTASICENDVAGTTANKANAVPSPVAPCLELGSLETLRIPGSVRQVQRVENAPLRIGAGEVLEGAVIFVHVRHV